MTPWYLCTERRCAGQAAGGGRRGLLPQQTQLRRRQRGGQRGEPGHHRHRLAAVLPQTGNVFIKTLELETKVAEYYAKFYNHGEAPTSD